MKALRGAGYVGWVLAGAILGLGLNPARAAETETRSFAIVIDGKPSGSYVMTIRQKDAATVNMTAQAEVTVKVLGLTAYHYAYRGQEVWKDGRLVRFESQSTEDRKTYSVSAEKDGDALRVKANGRERLAPGDVWVNTFWRLPDARQRGKDVPLLRCDYGTDAAGKLERIGEETLTVAGRQTACTHYRLVGSPTRELWYDDQDRLVRQEWTADGHASVLELTGLTGTGAAPRNR